MKRLLATLAVAIPLFVGTPVLAQVQLDHDTSEKLIALGIDTSLVVDEDDVGNINQILASDADDATKKAQLLELFEDR